MKYRPEIDGLRAIAVVPVIFFHAGITGFGGGFIGVDIFFVISGYLITSIITQDLENDNFSILSFYERRVRRILPVLIFVIVFCLPFAWKLMLPTELVAFGKSVVSSLLFLSNVLFWQESGYFDPATELKPLLHTWSLAVEEQYYIFFPVFMAAIWQFGRKLILLVLCLAALASLAFSSWASTVMPSVNFYFAPSRAWEILVGAAFAMAINRQQPRSEILGLLGLCLVLASLVFFDESTPTPSLLTLFPVLGTALVLGFAHRETLVGRLLSFRPFVLVGLISYGAYLWHQPVLAFARMRSVEELSAPNRVALIVLTFALALLSWKYVERPFRGKSPLFPLRRSMFLATGGATLSLVLVGLVLTLFDGYPNRTAPSGIRFSDVPDLEERLMPNFGLNSDCDPGYFTDSPKCRTSDRPTAVIWGDSYAMHLVQAFQSSQTDIEFVQMTMSQCGPLYGLAINAALFPWTTCMNFNDEVMKWMFDNRSVELVIISSPFRQTDRDVYRRDGTMITGQIERRRAITESLRDLRALLADIDIKLVVISAPAINGRDLGYCSLRSELMSAAKDACDFPVEEFLEYSSASIRLLDSVQQHVPVVWLPDLTCGEFVCRTTYDGVPLFRDVGHLSIAGSTRLGETVDLVSLIKDSALLVKEDEDRVKKPPASWRRSIVTAPPEQSNRAGG